MKKTILSAGLPIVVATSAWQFSAAAETDSLTVELHDVEIVANRASAKIPVAFTNVLKSDLRNSNEGRDIPYLLGMTPSMVSTSDAGGGVGYTSLRVRGSDASRINVTANGIPINDAESHQVYWVNMPDLASSLRDIQIQRGAGTSTNGAGAFGASINMITDAPSDDPYAELNASYGSYNTNKQTFRAGSGLLGDHWTADIRLSHVGSDGYIDRAFSKLWSYFGQLAYQNGGTQVRLVAFGGKEETYMAWDYASKEEMELYGRRYNPCGRYTASDGTTAYYPDQTDHFVQHHFQLLLSQRLTERLHLSAALHYTDDNGYYTQYKTDRTLVEYGLQPFMLPDGTMVEKSDLVRLKYNRNHFGGATVALNYRHGRWDGAAGAAVNRFQGNHFGQVSWVRNYVGEIDPLQEYYRNRGEKTDANVYARASYTITRDLSAYADLQYRHIDYTIRGVNDVYDWNTGSPAMLDVDQHYDFFNPKAGLNWTRGAHRAYASWSVAHKEPVRSNFTEGDPGRYPTSERMFDYEAGYFYSTRLFAVGANLYYMDYKNQLVTTGQLSDTGNPLSVNVPRSYRAGIELQGELHPVSWFDWQINATVSRNRIKDFVEYIYEDGWTNPITLNCGDTPIAFSPAFTLANSFGFKTAGFDGQLASRYVSKQYLTNSGSDETVLDPYFVTDLHAGYTFRGIVGVKSLRLGLSVYNLFSEKYFGNGYAGAGYTRGDDGKIEIYRYAGYAAQAPVNFMGSVAINF
ncbi:MAG: TonB-dependent receptor plug domain-containing protein [Bacteroidales bacterium]|nr:TonB-dependent receptor plug domain-containing protein [Bacteroidales bacterium]